MAITRLVSAALVLLFIASALGHSYVTSPISRSNQKQTNSGCRGPNCLGPCDAKLKDAITPAVTIARGEAINVQWPRNNHAGGFIRFAWTQTSNSDSHEAFDAGVQLITCHEVGGCKPDDAKNPNGGDSGPADGSRQPCQTSVTVPLHLTDGKWTLQWAWFGGAFELGDYYSCVDYVIKGGAAVSSKLDAVFKGGDFSNPNSNQCKFFNTDRLHQCVNEPCSSPIFSRGAQQSGPAYLPSSSNPTPKPDPTPTKVTTGAIVNNKPLTTGKVSTPAPNPNQNVGQNCAGLTKAADADAKITTVDTWSNVFRMVVQIDVHEDLSNWMLQVVWPSDATSTEVNSVFNAGQLKCSANSPVRHAMISPAKWAQKVKSGEQLSIEVIADNTNMAGAFIKANTAVRILKQ